MENNHVYSPAQAGLSHHIQSINALIEKLRRAEIKVEQYQVSIGRHIAAIKTARPDDWEGVVKTQCKLSRSRAYELMAIGDGSKTSEQTRDQANARKIKHRKSVRSGTDNVGEGLADNDASASAAIVTTETTAVGTPTTEQAAGAAEELGLIKIKAARVEDEIAELKDEHADVKDEIADLKDENARLRKALEVGQKLRAQISERLCEARGLSRHLLQNRAALVAKINAALKLAEDKAGHPKEPERRTTLTNPTHTPTKEHIKALCRDSHSGASGPLGATLDIVAIADGSKTIEQTRDQANARKIKHRKSVRSGTDNVGEGAVDNDAPARRRLRNCGDALPLGGGCVHA